MYRFLRHDVIRLAVAGLAIALPTAVSFGADASPEPVSEFERALFTDATFTAHLRSYLLDRYDSPGNDPGAWAIGGWLGYETDWIGDAIKFGAVGYTSQPPWAPEDRDGTLLLLPGQEGYGVIGQAYASLKFQDQVLTVYRQLVNQPEVNAQDNRMTPNTFEGGTVTGEIGPIGYYAAYLTAMKKRNAVDFVNIAGASGVNENSDMLLGTLSFSPIDDFKARTSLYSVPNVLTSSYSDAVWTAALTDEAKLRLSGQFMAQSSIGKALTGEDYSAWIGGMKGDLIYRGLTLTAGYTHAGEDYNWNSPYGSWPGYTSMIVEDFNRAEEQAVLLGASYDFAELGAEGLVVTAAAALDVDVADDLPEQQEYDFTTDYKFSALEGEWDWLSPLWIRVRYALVEKQNPDDTDVRRDDFRVIVNYELQFSGKDL